MVMSLILLAPSWGGMINALVLASAITFSSALVMVRLLPW